MNQRRAMPLSVQWKNQRLINREELIRGPLVVSELSSPVLFAEAELLAPNEKGFVGFGRAMQ